MSSQSVVVVLLYLASLCDSTAIFPCGGVLLEVAVGTPEIGLPDDHK